MKTLGKFAVYNGREYQFLDLNNGSFSLISNDENDINIGFQKIRFGRYAKDVQLQDVEFIFEKNTIVKYKGDEFIGSIIENDKIMLYTRDTTLGKKYNMIMRDKDEYYLYVKLKEIDEIIQRWLPLEQYNRV